MLLLLLILVILLYLKWILISLAFPWVCLLFQFRRHKGTLRKVLAVPGLAIEKMTRDGASRYIILNIGHRTPGGSSLQDRNQDSLPADRR